MWKSFGAAAGEHDAIEDGGGEGGEMASDMAAADRLSQDPAQIVARGGAGAWAR